MLSSYANDDIEMADADDDEEDEDDEMVSASDEPEESDGVSLKSHFATSNYLNFQFLPHRPPTKTTLRLSLRTMATMPLCGTSRTRMRMKSSKTKSRVCPYLPYHLAQIY